MKIKKLSYQETGRFSTLVLDYINQKKSVKDFISEFPTIKNFHKQIDKKSNDVVDREYDVFEWIDTRKKSKGKQKIGKKMCRFVQPLDGSKSIIPNILLRIFIPVGPSIF